MTDVFLSYSSKDRELVRPLVEVLEQHGWSVWWDQEIPSGSNFGKVIEKHLSTARCCIVAWTRNSVDSDWVRNEASDALSRGALIPVALEKGIKFPLEFRQVETRDLSEWRPGEAHAQFERLFQDLQQRLNSATASTSAAPAAQASSIPSTSAAAHPRSRRSLWRTATGSWWYALTLLALPAVFVGAIAWLLMQWKMSVTNVELDLTLSRLRVQFTGPEPGARGWSVPVTTEPLGFRSLVVQNLKEAELEPQCLSIVTQAEARDCAPRDAGLPVAVTLSARARRTASLGIESIETAQPVNESSKLQLQTIDVPAGASVAFKSDLKQPQRLSLDLQSPALTTHVLGDGLLRLAPTNATINGVAGAQPADDFAVNARTGNPSLLIRLIGSERALGLRVERGAKTPVSLLASSGAQVSAIDAGRMADGEQGQEVSALVEVSELRYADLPADNKITLTPPTLLKLKDLKDFWITQLRYDPGKGAYLLRAHGGASRIATFVGNTGTDRRLSWFDRLWNDPKLRVLFTIITFVLGATPGLIKLLAESKQS